MRVVERTLIAAVAVVASVCGTGCAARIVEPVPRVVAAPGEAIVVTWSAEEQKQDVALRLVRKTDYASYHVVRIATAEKPHVHDRSDGAVTVLAGEMKIHFAGRVIPVKPGDVLDIPRGAPHWAENTSQTPSVVFVVFTPPLDPSDRRPVPDPSPGQ